MGNAILFTTLGGVVWLSCCAMVWGSSRAVEDMVYIPAGEFIMGTSAETAARLAKEYGVNVTLFTKAEHEQTKVFVQAFYIDRYEVTNQQYQAFVKVMGHPAPDGWDGADYPQGEADYPVTGMTWQDAQAYAVWAGKRLPTEAEWEKAARGTDGRLYPWGNEWQAGACCMDEARRGGDPFGRVPVGSYQEDVSPYGVMDMAGNLAEWTSDIAQNIAYKDFRIHKGGCYVYSQPYNFRCAGRGAQPPMNSNLGYIGFRCVKDAPGPVASTQSAAPLPASVHPGHSRSGRIPMPRPELYLKEPIELVLEGSAESSHAIAIRPPYLPGNGIYLNVLESFNHISEIEGKHWAANKRFERAEDGRSIVVWWKGPDIPESRLEAEVRLVPGLDDVDITYTIKNGGVRARSLGLSTCCEARRAPIFRDHEGSRVMVFTPRGAESVNRQPAQALKREYFRMQRFAPSFASDYAASPFTMVVSRDGQWLLSETAGRIDAQFNNLEGCCQHADPIISIQPGEQKVIKQKIYIMKGSPDELLRRWRADFGKDTSG